MENNFEPSPTESHEVVPEKKDEGLLPRLMFAAVIVALVSLFALTSQKSRLPSIKEAASASALEDVVRPAEGITLAVTWDDIGAKMISVGVIDAEKFEAIYSGRGGLNEDEKKLLYGTDNGNIKITRDNSGVLLNLLWALGLGNKNAILDDGPMQKYGDADRFASTGGWTLARGKAMEHYSRHPLIILTSEQQKIVERVSQGIYRPCCDNPTYFPDCNHGMAMLGLLELMASQGVSERDMYKAALQVNAYWFPDTYLTIAKYLKMKDIEWEKADPKEILGRNYSSFSGYQMVLKEVTPPEGTGGGSCGV